MASTVRLARCDSAEYGTRLQEVIVVIAVAGLEHLIEPGTFGESDSMSTCARLEMDRNLPERVDGSDHEKIRNIGKAIQRRL